MKSICVSFFSVLLTFYLYNCEDEGPGKRNWPGINTLDVTDISEDGACFKAEIISRGDYEILEYGFVWSENPNPNLNNSDRVVFSDKTASAIFTARIVSTLGKGIIYYVKSFIKTAEYTIYGDQVIFESLGSQAPVIDSFSPSSASEFEMY